MASEFSSANDGAVSDDSGGEEPDPTDTVTINLSLPRYVKEEAKKQPGLNISGFLEAQLLQEVVSEEAIPEEAKPEALEIKR